MAKTKTIADRIRQMTNEELVAFMEKLENQEIDFGISFCGGECDEKYECNDCRRVWLTRDFNPLDFWSKGIASKEDIKAITEW